MTDTIRLAIEQSQNGIMLHLVDLPGAFTRARTFRIAIDKVPYEAEAYWRWIDKSFDDSGYNIEIIQKENTKAQIDDGDTEILILRDKIMERPYFEQLKKRALKSAEDFKKLYDSIPDKELNDTTKNRTTFYGKVPSNAKEMLAHADFVKDYYLNRIDISFGENENDFVANRIKCIKLIEADDQAYKNKVITKHEESWTTAKVLRRFIWHDRIHARALYRFAVEEWGEDKICNSFKFDATPGFKR